VAVSGIVRGVVRHWNLEKAFGFIVGEDSVAYFVHKHQVMYHEDLVPGQRVVFQAADAPRGPRAVGVQRLEPAESERAH
jgi:cold shock CspA family protein